MIPWDERRRPGIEASILRRRRRLERLGDRLRQIMGAIDDEAAKLAREVDLLAVFDARRAK